MLWEADDAPPPSHRRDDRLPFPAMPARRSRADAAARRAAALDGARLADFGRRLRAWYRRAARDLPWRRTRDPYAILVSELMLQQTQVARVIDFWHAFLARFPSLHHVAEAPESHVLEQWQGLGYYARARNLHRLARHVVRERNGALPDTPESLRALPGIGAYTAGAVASFAFEKRAPLVDTNVARVLQRAFAPRLAPKSGAGQKVLWAIAERLLPRTGAAAWTHNQALMELGALVCTAREARCGICPVVRACATGSAAAPRPPRTRRR